MKYLLLLFLCISANAADRSIFISSNVAPGGTPQRDLAVVPVGKKLVVERVGITDVSLAQRPSIVRLIWGGDLIREISVTGQTIELPIKGIVLEGDGVKFLRIERHNPESVAKVISVWIEVNRSNIKN